MRETVIEACGLVKRYGAFKAVDGLDLNVRAGEIFGLLGPNGAGKTTTILMLLGLTEPSGGSVRVAGLDPVRDPLGVKRMTGYMPDNIGFYDEMTGRENLNYVADLNGIAAKEAAVRISTLLERVGLTHAADKKVGAYSRGMRQRLGLAEVLLKQPRIVIMDEPTLGLDPEGARQFLELIKELAGEGMTVLLSSHLLHQVQQVCDRVGIFVRGRMIACGPVSELADQALAGEPLRLALELSPCPEALVAALRQLDGVESVVPAGGDAEAGAAGGDAKAGAAGGGRLELTSRWDVRPEVGRVAGAHGAVILHLSQAGRTLDDIYRRYFYGEEGRYGKEGRHDKPAAGAAAGVASA